MLSNQPASSLSLANTLIHPLIPQDKTLRAALLSCAMLLAALLSTVYIYAEKEEGEESRVDSHQR